MHRRKVKWGMPVKVSNSWQSIRLLTATLVLCPSIAIAECRVHDNGESILLGRFQYEYAYGDCIKVYKNHYLKEYNDGDSELYLRCKGKEQLIAVVRNYEFSYTGIDVAGCAIPKTMG